MSLFDICPKELEIKRVVVPDLPEAPDRVLLTDEKEACGVYISGHPLDYLSKACGRYSTVSSSAFQRNESGEAEIGDEEEVSVLALIKNIKKIYSKKGDPMAFVTAEDLVGEVEMVVFPRPYADFERILKEDSICRFIGKASDSGDEDKAVSMIVEQIIPVEDLPLKVYVRFPDIEVIKAESTSIKNIALQYPGTSSVIAVHKNNRYPIAPMVSLDIYKELKEKYGKDNVIIY